MTELYVPLEFWFNKSSELAIPVAHIPTHSYYIDLNEQLMETTTDDIIRKNKQVVETIADQDVIKDEHLFNPDCMCGMCQELMLMIEI